MPYQGTGREITRAVVTDITKVAVSIELAQEWEHWPAEHRANLRRQHQAAAQSALAQGRAAIREWAVAEAEDAHRVLRARPIGSSAEEQRRTTNELRLGRLVDLGRASGATSAAKDLADRAERAYLDGADYDEAVLLARAAIELGADARRTLDGAQQQLDLADPAKAKALKAIAEADIAVAIYERDAVAAYSRALQSSASLARHLGEFEASTAAIQEASEASVAAKISAAIQSRESGEPYREPVGVLASGPTGAAGGTLPEPRS